MHNSGLPGVAPMSPQPSPVVMTEQLIIQHLKQCRDLTRGFAYRVFPIFWRQWCKQLLEVAEQAKNNKDQVILFETQNLIVAVQQAAEQEFCQHLANGYVKFKNRTLNTLTGEERFTGGALSLVDHADLEETIAITSITHRADNFFAEQLWALHQRMALLNNGEKIEEPSNPASPVQFCEAIRKVLASLEIDLNTKTMGYKIFEQEVIGQLESLFEDLNDYLIRQNLLPNLRFVPGADKSPSKTDENAIDDHPSEQTDAVEATEATTEPSSQAYQRAGDKLLNGVLNPNDVQYQNSLLNAIRVLQTHVNNMPGRASTQLVAEHSPGDNSPVPAFAAAVVAEGRMTYAPVDLQVYTQSQLVRVLDQIQHHSFSNNETLLANANLGNASFTPQSAADVSRQMMQQIATENEKGAVESSDMQTIDLVGMLFEYMLSDNHLPDSIKALLSYLHTPFLKMAFIDKGFFEQPEHPARVLLNSLAEAGVRWVSNDGSDQYDIFNKIKTTVFHLLREFKNDVRIFAESLIEFKAYVRNVARRQELMERRALEKAQGEEKLREAKIQVNSEVRKRTDGRDMPSAILLLLLQPWSDFMSFILLRYGEKSDTWMRALQIIDELLWTLEPKTLQMDKARQQELQGHVVEGLERGFETIGYDQAKGRKLLEAVVSLQRMALLSRRAEPAPAQMRTKLESMASEKAGQIVTDVQALTPEETKIMDSLKLVEFGTWFEFDDGKRLKVAWYNKKTQHYMLVDQQGRKVLSIAGLQLARDMIAGKTKIIAGSTKPFFERALENIYNTLNERADTLKAGKS